MPLFDPGRAERRRAQARGVRLGDVRLRQLGLHHGRADGGVQRLLRRRRRRQRAVGHAWPGRCALALSSADRDAHDAGARRLADLRAAKKRLLAFTHGRLRASPRRCWRWPGRATCGWRWLRSCCRTSSTRYGESLTAAFLPELARREALGRVSGWGWSFGYFGGMLTLGPVAGLRAVGAGAGHAGDAVRAGDDAHHRRRLCAVARWPRSRC